MEIDQIRYFLAVCETRNFTRAANICGVKQPSITNAIRRLERSIGGELFVRSSTPVQLTKLGSQLHPICKRISALIEAARGISVHEPGHGTSRPFAAMQHSGRFRSKAGMTEPRLQKRIYEHKTRSKALTIAAGDALIAALKAKSENPDSAITYVRKSNRRGDHRHPHEIDGQEDQQVLSGAAAPRAGRNKRQ